MISSSVHIQSSEHIKPRKPIQQQLTSLEGSLSHCEKLDKRKTFKTTRQPGREDLHTWSKLLMPSNFVTNTKFFPKHMSSCLPTQDWEKREHKKDISDSQTGLWPPTRHFRPAAANRSPSSSVKSTVNVYLGSDVEKLTIQSPLRYTNTVQGSMMLKRNYFTSSDPHRDIILKHICHKSWHSLC